MRRVARIGLAARDGRFKSWLGVEREKNCQIRICDGSPRTSARAAPPAYPARFARAPFVRAKGAIHVAIVGVPVTPAYPAHFARAPFAHAKGAMTDRSLGWPQPRLPHTPLALLAPLSPMRKGRWRIDRWDGPSRAARIPRSLHSRPFRPCERGKAYLLHGNYDVSITRCQRVHI